MSSDHAQKVLKHLKEDIVAPAKEAIEEIRKQAIKKTKEIVRETGLPEVKQKEIERNIEWDLD